MSQVTITDVKPVKLMGIDEIEKWIYLHQKALKSESMESCWGAINDDLKVLEREVNERNIISNIGFVVNEMSDKLTIICDVLKSIEISLNKKEEEGEENGTTSN